MVPQQFGPVQNDIIGYATIYRYQFGQIRLTRRRGYEYRPKDGNPCNGGRQKQDSDSVFGHDAGFVRLRLATHLATIRRQRYLPKDFSISGLILVMSDPIDSMNGVV